MDVPMALYPVWNMPVSGGKPNPGTKKDKRLTRNKPKPPVKKG